MTKSFPRPPVVVVLGHVDHGKTTLLDYIRKTNIAEKEIGKITQKIGAYEVEVNIKGYQINKITFIDTPGHEIFTKLRLRGAEVADIAVLVIDAVDSVMPQTIESIYHIKQAKIPFIIAANKIDLPQANLDKLKKDLAKQNLLVEGFGGEIPFVPISAKKGTGVNDLLEMIIFIASERNLNYSPENPIEAYIIESKKDKRGVIASVIIKNGKLKVGETVYALDNQAKIRAIISDKGRNLFEVYPSTPFLLLGFKEPPPVGVMLTREKRKLVKEQSIINKKQANLRDFFKKEEKKKLRLIIKTDNYGSLEAILSHISSSKDIEIILASTGEITKSDIFLAKISQAIVIGFSLSIDKNIYDLAKEEKVIVKSYSLIYELLEELKEVSLFLKEKEEKEIHLKGEAKILASFIIEKEKIAGIKVVKGKINLDDQMELYRDNKLIGKAKIVSLKKRAQPVIEVKKNEEAGIIFYPQLDFNIGDVIKSYSI